jgi:23S rRNA (guanosine2251-2'-O)-methyltransferase
MKSREIYLLLHNIRSVYNVGAIFRTADAVGVTKIYLSGYTPTPVDRFNNPRKDFAKSALGSEKIVPYEYMKSPGTLISRLKKEGVEIISIEQSKNSIDYKKVKPGGRCLIVFGNEVSGISKTILDKSDVIAEIPMKGKKESLNVSVSAGIILYRWFDR